jgi:hypothetical protein
MIARTKCYEEKFIMQNSFSVPGPDENNSSNQTHSIFDGDPGPDDSDPPEETLSIIEADPGPDDSDPPEETNFTFGTVPILGPGPHDDDPLLLLPPPQKRA